MNNKTNSYKESNIKLDTEIKRIFNNSKKRYGSPKITKQLNIEGFKVSQKRVAKRMKILKLRSITVKKYNHSGNSKCDNKKEYKNLLEQDFKANKPGIKWVGDITYIYTKETGWTYLAIVMDLFDLKVVGWSYGLNMTDDLVIDAFHKAMKNRKINENGIFHSEWGSQYTSNNYEKLLEGLKIKHSYSKKGYPYDNGPIEAFHSLLKREFAFQTTFSNFEDLVIRTSNYISWFNSDRIRTSV